MPINPKLIEYTSGKHPAYDLVEKYGWEKFVERLNEQVSLKRVIVKSMGDLRIYNYAGMMQLSKNKWCEITMVCRGLIIDDNGIVATGFPKFFNYNEVATYVDDYLRGNPSSFTSYDKLDGSLGIVFFHDSKWNVATRGAFSDRSCQAKWAEGFLTTLDKSNFRKGDTYLVEIICQESKIVVDYGWEGLRLLAGYDCNGHNLSYEDMSNLSIPLVKEFKFDSLEQILKAAKTIPASQEGWVILLGNGVRFKVKGDDYKLCHKARSDISYKRVKEMVLKNCDLDTFKSLIPNEFVTQVEDMVKDINKRIDDILSDVMETLEDAQGKRDKNLSVFMKKRNGKKLPRWGGICFEVTKKDYDKRLDREFIRAKYLQKIGSMI